MLYNGTSLSEPWPPQNIEEGSDEPLVVPYLDDPPDIVPIDSGRQLLVDDFLIATSTFQRTYHKPTIHPASPVLVPETDEELDDGYCPMAAPFNDGVCYDPEDGLYKLWYMPGWFHGTALATSEDGIHWTRPTLDVVPGTNIVWGEPGGYERDNRDGCLVWLDHDSDDPSERFKMFQYYRHTQTDGSTLGEGGLHVSPDGIHWSDPVITPTVGDNTSFFYNPFRKKWCMSIRHSSTRLGKLRARWYQERHRFLDTWSSDDEVFWQRVDRLDLPDPARPDRTPFLASSRQIGDWNRAYLHACGGLFTVADDELRFYFDAFSGESPRLGPTDEGPGRSRRVMYAGASTGMATLRRDGFASMDAGDEMCELLTRPVRFSGDRLFVNIDCGQEGELSAEVCDQAGLAIGNLDFGGCTSARGDTTRGEITWDAGNLGSAIGQDVCLKFRGRNCHFYSFWITSDPDGKSGGYVAAGGPGFSNGKDA